MYVWNLRSENDSLCNACSVCATRYSKIIQCVYLVVRKLNELPHANVYTVRNMKLELFLVRLLANFHDTGKIRKKVLYIK